MAANWLAAKTSGACDIVEIRGTRGSAPAIERQNGFKEVIGQYPGMRIVRHLHRVISTFKAVFRP